MSCAPTKAHRALDASMGKFRAPLRIALPLGLLVGMLACLPFGLLAGCGYHTNSYEGPDSTPDMKLPRIAVIPFETTSFRRGLEIRLSRKVADEIRARSPRSPADPKTADWHVTGTIVRADERVLSGDVDDSVRESSFWVTCEIVLRDPNTDRIIEKTEFTKYQPFSNRTAAGRFQTEQQAADEVLREIAEATVYWLESQVEKSQGLSQGQKTPNGTSKRTTSGATSSGARSDGTRKK